MARPVAVPGVPGVSDFRSLLDFLRSGEVYDKYLKQLEALQAECAKQIERVGLASEIESMRVQASTDRNMAAEELKNAKAEAARLLTDAHAAKDAALEDVKAWRGRAEVEIASRTLALSKQEQEAASTLAQGNHLMADGRQMKAEAEMIQKEGQAVKDEYDAKLTVLRQKMKEIGIAG